MLARFLKSRLFAALLVGTAAAALALSTLGVPSAHPLNAARIVHAEGNAYTAVVRSSGFWFLRLADDSSAHPADSTLQLYEDGQPLGPPHSQHADIRSLGGGRYSHWDGALIFSTRDNSDPSSNGRSYVIAGKWQLSWVLTVPLVAWALWRHRRRLYAAGQRLVRAHGMVVALLISTKAGRSLAATKAVRAGYIFGCVTLYLLIVAAGSIWWGSLDYYRPQPIAGADQQLQNRIAYYMDHRGDFDLIFLGDSRTYCGVHPERIDPLLGTRSINLASFSNWFPTQYAEVKQLTKVIPKGTTVVLTVGHQNFDCLGKIQRVFPIDIPTALRYSAMDMPQEGLWDNVAFYNAYLHFWAVRDEIRERFLNWARSTLPWPTSQLLVSVELMLLESTASAAPMPTAVADAPPATWLTPPVNTQVVTSTITQRTTLTPEVGELVRRYASDPQVSLVDVSTDGDQITSVLVYYRGGGYYRIEVDHAFFRAQQQANPHAPNLATASNNQIGATIEVSLPKQACLALFSRILDALEEHDLHVIVNEIEEAPYTYGSSENRQAYRDVMQRTVQPIVEAHGFRYVTTRLEDLEDADYFDYNHLNSQGIEKYAPMLAAALRPLLANAEPH